MTLQTYFEPVIKRRRRNNTVAALILFLLSASGASWCASSGSTRSFEKAHLLAASLVGGAVAFACLVVNLRPHRGLAALGEPARIVWTYGVNRSGHVGAVVVGFDDGGLFRFPLPLISVREGFAGDAFALLRASAPHATHGYSEAYRVAFRQNPQSLRRLA